MHDDASVPLLLGDGGAVTSRFVRDEILSRFRSASLLELEDSAGIDIAGHAAMVTTDTFVVDPPVFPGGDIGRLAVAGTVNDLVASGARPRFLTMGLLVAEGFAMGDLRRILDSLAAAAQEAGAEVVAGDTKSIPRNAGLGICINTTGIGTQVRPGRRYRLCDARPGDAIIVSGSLADHAIAVLSQREGLGLEQRVCSDCAPLADLVLPLLQPFDGIHAMRDPTRGGVAGVLHDLAEASGLRVRVEDARLPLQRVVRFGCEMLGLHPLDLANEGKMVLVVTPDQANDVVAALREHPLGRDAARIGDLAESLQPGVEVVSDRGERRILARYEGHPIPRLC